MGFMCCPHFIRQRWVEAQALVPLPATALNNTKLLAQADRHFLSRISTNSVNDFKKFEQKLFKLVMV
jgi:hypothetical protein